MKTDTKYLILKQVEWIFPGHCCAKSRKAHNSSRNEAPYQYL